MKHIKKLFAATILTFILTAAALAGDTHTPSIVAPPPPMVNPQTPKLVTTTAATNYDALTEAALQFCYKMLSIF